MDYITDNKTNKKEKSGTNSTTISY